MNRIILFSLFVYFVLALGGCTSTISDAQFSDLMDRYLSDPTHRGVISGAVFGNLDEKVKAQKEKSLKEKVDGVLSKLSDPLPVPVGDSPIIGDAAAPLTILLFADFECPYCQDSFRLLKKLVEDYPKDILLAFKHFPIKKMHPRAEKAAEISLAANKQGAFWELATHMFEEPSDYSTSSLNRLLAKTSIDKARFYDDLSKDVSAFRKVIERDTKDAELVSIRATPGIVINGLVVTGHLEREFYDALIDAYKKQKAQL